MHRRLGALGAAVAALALPGTALASSSGVVVSQVYGGGGNSGATYANDYVELFNAGSAAVPLDGWSVQYASAAGTGSFAVAATLSGSLAPGRRVLVRESGGTTGASIPAPDFSGTTNMSATAGKVALVDQATSLGCNGGSTPCAEAQRAHIVDLVGYGNANFFEGSAPAPGISATSAALRGGEGCVDTDDNAADFTAGTPAPRNASAAATRCDAVALRSSSPADGATGVPVGSDITLTFSEPVSVDPGFATLTCDGAPVDVTVGGGPTTYTLDPVDDLGLDRACTVSVDHTKVRAADDATNGLPADRTIGFRTQPAPTAISAIQGAGHLSPLRGETVRTLGIVTARRSNGFWIQSTEPDGDARTSEGLFVFGGGAVPGDAVDVTGRVAEFRPGATGLSITELTSPAVTVVSSGNDLPAPQLIGPGGRMPSDTVIEDDATDVELDGVFDVDDGIDFYESLEGMRVEVADAVASGPTSDFGSNREIPVLAGDGVGTSVRTPRGGIIVRPGDFNPERIILNDALTGGPRLPAAGVGDRFPGSTIGVLDYSFSNYKLEATTLPAREPGGIAREVGTAAAPGELSFATFNVENLDPGDGEAKFARLASLIVDNLRSPDVVSLEEVQDNDGPANSGTVNASQTLSQLVDAIAAAGGPAYETASIDPSNNQDGGEPGGNIRVAFLYRTDRGLSFTPKAGGGATTAVTVEDGPSLSSNPGRIDPTNGAFANSRKPLAGEFGYDGRKLFVVANHWNSKGGDEPLYGPHQPPTLSSETQRTQQAQVVHDFVTSLLDRDPGAQVVLLGDFNDFSFSKPLTTLTEDGTLLEDLITRLPVGERYSYVFEGNSQALDHIVASPSVADRLRLIDPVHVNAEFADQASDHDPLVALSCADRTAPVPSVSLSRTTLSPPNHKYVRVTATVSATDAHDPSPTIAPASATSSEPDDAPGGADGSTTEDVRVVDSRTFDLRAERDETGPGRTYTITYRATDACGNAATRSATVTVR